MNTIKPLGSNCVRVGGYMWEKEVFGVSSNEFSFPPYKSWYNSLVDACNRQPNLRWNPSQPHTVMGREILDCVRSYIPRDIAQDVMFWCAIGTSFDWYHGVDGFFTLRGRLVTIDLSLRIRDDPKASLVISKDKADIQLWRVCMEIASLLY